MELGKIVQNKARNNASEENVNFIAVHSVKPAKGHQIFLVLT